MKVRRSFLLVMLLLVAIAAAYSTSFRGQFVLDDQVRIVESVLIRDFKAALSTFSIRYVADLTLAFDFARGGLNPAYYHLTNLMIHLSCALALFLLVKSLSQIAGKSGARADWIAFVSALIWGVHPLTTSSVTYICQRYESLMSLFYLLSMLMLVKGSKCDGLSGKVMMCFSVIMFLCGAFTKQVMITAPAVLLLLDVSFLSHGIGKALKKHRLYYASLGVCWLAQIAVIHSQPNAHSAMLKTFAAELGSGMYLMNQAPVLLHYLRLVFLPHPLTLDYAWQPVLTVSELLLPTAIVGALFFTCLYGFARWPKAFFAAVCVFVVLSPTSSLVPIPDLAFEHRMYLPLAFLVVSIVSMMDKLLRRQLPQRIGAIIALGIALALGLVTLERNVEYSDPETMWGEITERIPHNFRAWSSLAGAKYKRGDYHGAERTARAMLSRVALARAGDARRTNIPSSNPEIYEVFGRNLLGLSLMGIGRTEESLEHFSWIVSRYPSDLKARHNRAMALLTLGNAVQAEEELNYILAAHSDNVEASMVKAKLLADAGKHEQAVDLLTRLLSRYPRLTPAKVELAWLLCTSFDDGVRDASKAEKILAEAEVEIGVTGTRLFEVKAALCAEMGDFDNAVELQTEAIRDAARQYHPNDPRVPDMKQRLVSYRGKTPYRTGKSPGREVTDDK